MTGLTEANKQMKQDKVTIWNKKMHLLRIHSVVFEKFSHILRTRAVAFPPLSFRGFFSQYIADALIPL